MRRKQRLQYYGVKCSSATTSCFSMTQQFGALCRHTEREKGRRVGEAEEAVHTELQCLEK